VNFTAETDPHLIAGLLKAFLRELPEPLFTWGLYKEFVEAGGMLPHSFLFTNRPF
jgi:hypothetical protein